MDAKDFDNMIQIAEEVRAVRKGEASPAKTWKFEPSELKMLRNSLGYCQADFARLVHISVDSLRSAEQGRRESAGLVALVKVLNKIRDDHPEVLHDVIKTLADLKEA